MVVGDRPVEIHLGQGRIDIRDAGGGRRCRLGHGAMLDDNRRDRVSGREGRSLDKQ